jgi:CRP/FNR family transcriptional regulator, nitrogen fixation regulation protein
MFASSLTTDTTRRPGPASIAASRQAATAPHAPADPLAALDAAATTVTRDKDQTIYAEGDPADFCYRIVSGCVRTVKLMEDGRRQVVEFLLPGDLLGRDALDTHHQGAEAVTAVVLRATRRSALETLADSNPAIARRLRSLAADGMRQAWERMMLLGRKTAVERIASFVLEMAARAPRAGQAGVPLPMSRADIADHLGLTMETVCRTLSCLRQEGAIGLGRSVNGAQVTIRDAAALRALATAARH